MKRFLEFGFRQVGEVWGADYTMQPVQLPSTACVSFAVALGVAMRVQCHRS